MEIRRGSTGALNNRVTYSYDAAGRLSQLGTGLHYTTITYDARFNAERFRWGATGDTLVLKHPSVGAPGQYRYSDATVEAFAGLHYARDPLRRTSERWNGDLSQWDEHLWEPTGRLSSVLTWEENGQANCTWDDDIGDFCEESNDTTLLAHDSYRWDDVGNPDSAGDSVEVGNRLVELGSISLTYDADGNITSRSGGGETVTYWWNSLSQLDSANSSVSGKIRYTYDAFGRRVSTNDAAGTTLFLWDGEDVVADIDGSGNVLRRYNYYPGLANLHSMRVGSSEYLYLKDVNQNVLGLLNESGTLVNTYKYSPFGETTSVREGVANRFRFASGEQDRIGLYYFRARHYEPEFMRFLSQDPIGLAGGINPYVYAANNPVDFRDPTGLLMAAAWDYPWGIDPTKGESDNFLNRGGNAIPTVSPVGKPSWEGSGTSGSRDLAMCSLLVASIAFNGALDAATVYGLGTGMLLRSAGVAARGGARILMAGMRAEAGTVSCQRRFKSGQIQRSRVGHSGVGVAGSGGHGWLRFEWSERDGEAGVSAVSQAIAFAADVEGGGVMEQAIE